MTRKLTDYMDDAVRNQGLKNYSELAVRLKLTHAAMSQYKKGVNWPSESTMIRLAEMGKNDVNLALLQLREWSAKDAASKSVWKNLKRSLQAAAVLSIMGFMSLNTAGFNGMTKTVSGNTVDREQFILC